MKSTIALLLMISSLKTAISLEISGESQDNGLVLSPNGVINVRELNKHLFYTFDTSMLSFISGWQKNVKCNDFIHKIEFEPFDEMPWTQIKPEPNTTYLEVKKVDMKLCYSEILDANLNKFNSADKTSTECETLHKMSRIYQEANEQLNKLAAGDISSINDIINLSTVLVDISEIITKYGNKFDVPFTFIFEIEKEISKYGKFEFFYQNNMVTLSFQIPIYRTVTLYNAYKKPIIVDKRQYILKDIGEFAITELENTLFFSKRELDRVCIDSNEQKYCEKPKRSTFCEDQIDRIPFECLERQPLGNVVTKIDQDLYFAITNPIVINVTCESSKYKLYINSYVRINNNMACKLESGSFLFDPNKPNMKIYEMSFLPYSDEHSLSHTILNITDILTEFINIFLGYLLFLICTNLVTFYISRRNAREKSANSNQPNFDTASSIIYTSIQDLRN